MLNRDLSVRCLTSSIQVLSSVSVDILNLNKNSKLTLHKCILIGIFQSLEFILLLSAIFVRIFLSPNNISSRMKNFFQSIKCPFFFDIREVYKLPDIYVGFYHEKILRFIIQNITLLKFLL